MADLLDGKVISARLKEELKEDVLRCKKRGLTPRLAVILAGGDPASVYYAQAKKKVAEYLGIAFSLHVLEATVREKEVLALIRRLNEDALVHGIMVELPLPPHLDERKLSAAIVPNKDVDGVHPMNRGRLLSGEAGLYPATPQSCIEIVKRSGLELAGKHVVLVGRGVTVGKPLIFMVLKENATLTVCHSQTKDLALYTKQADILIVAAGKAGLIRGNMVKPAAVVVDAGINETEEGMRGDVDFETVSQIAGWLSPVPGGVGSLTTALLMRNVLRALYLQEGV